MDVDVLSVIAGPKLTKNLAQIQTKIKKEIPHTNPEDDTFTAICCINQDGTQFC